MGNTDKLEECVDQFIDKVWVEAFKNRDVNDFGDFNASLYTTDAGEYSFSVDQKLLKEVVKVLNVASHNNIVFGVQVFKNKVKFHVFNQNIFSEIFIPAVSEIEDTKEESVSFLIEKDLLNKVASRFGDSKIHFVYKAEINSLVVSSGNTRLELNLFKGNKPVNYHAKLKSPDCIGKINPDSLRDAVKYISYFVRRDDRKKNLSQADSQRGMLYGGSHSSVGIYTSSLFNFAFNIKYDNLSYLYRVLPYFNKENTYLFNTENYYILRDENIYFGFEKSIYRFPPVDKFLSAKISKEKFIVSRGELLDSLNKLSIAILKDRSFIKIGISGLMDNLVCELFVRDTTGKVSSDKLSAYLEGVSYPEGSGALFNAVIELNTFKEVISHFNSDNVCVQYITGKALVIRDVGEGFEAVSNFSLFSETQLNKI